MVIMMESVFWGIGQIERSKRAARASWNQGLRAGEKGVIKRNKSDG
jgi:hypothetical protein